VLAFFSFTVTAVSGIMFLRTGDLKWDDIAISSVKLGFIFGGLHLQQDGRSGSSHGALFGVGTPRLSPPLSCGSYTLDI